MLSGSGVAVASVALDSNSGMGLLVNKEAKVLRTGDAIGDLNNVLGGLDLKGQDIYEVVSKFVYYSLSDNHVGELIETALQHLQERKPRF